MASKDVYVIGAGIVSPFGLSKEDFWNGLNNPASDSINRQTYQSTSPRNFGKEFYCKRVENFSASSYYSEKELYKLDRNSEFVVVAE